LINNRENGVIIIVAVKSRIKRGVKMSDFLSLILSNLTQMIKKESANI